VNIFRVRRHAISVVLLAAVLPHPKLAAYREKAVVSQWHRIAFFAAAAAGVTLKNNREKHRTDNHLAP
jgi:hypothetical protein